MSDVKTWDVSAGGNAENAPDGAPEGMDKAAVNDTIREVMAAIRRWYQDPQWVNPFATVPTAPIVTRENAQAIRIAGFSTSSMFVPAGRKLRLLPGMVEVFTESAAISGPDLLVGVSGNAVPVGTNGLEMASLHGGESAYRRVIGATEPLEGPRLISLDGLTRALTASTFLGDAAERNVGVDPGEIPLVDDLGTAALLDAGTAGEELADNDRVVALIALARATSETIKSTAQDNVAAGVAAITDLTGKAFPATPDGIKQFRVTAIVSLHNDSGSTVESHIRLHLGTNGDETDTIFTEARNLSGLVPNVDRSFIVGPILMKPNLGETVTVSVDVGQQFDVLTANRATRLLIERVL